MNQRETNRPAADDGRLADNSLVSKDQDHRAWRETLRLRIGFAIPVLMFLMPLILGIFHYRFLEELLRVVPNDSPLCALLAETLLAVYVSTFILCAVALLFGLGLSWAIFRPIRELIRTTHEIATGNLSRIARADSRDEFGVLGNSFNEMIASLNRMITERNRYILECYTGGLILADSAGRIIATNTAAEQILGEPSSAMISRPISEVLVRHEGAQHFREIIERAVTDRQFVTSREITVRFNDGKSLPLVVTTSPLRDLGGGRGGVVINFRDLSQVKAFYRQMTRADRLATIGTLAAGLAHEVRNPLGSIKGLAQMLSEESPPDSETRKYAEVIIREVNRCDGVVRELLEFSQGDHQQVRLWNVNEVLREALETARWKAAEQTEGKIHIRENYGEVPAIPLNAERMGRALLNLVVNAIEACSDGGEVAVSSAVESAKDSPDVVLIRIENTGQTIAPENIERVFEPFFSTKPGGTGLGLPIAYQIITSHGGTIDVESRNGRTAISVRLPVTLRSASAA
ncbi:MAG: ATP-binding protein [Candidatus Sumerlaeia bacterium]|nr:ATP-binding protein [Candidatus Sumerlaeia bacterium]